ncbi:MAG: NAD(P)H-hydrate dehydratase [Ruminococcaceae bacterium]|nr:NAD(P)H-hydrate dehydratase [Oscillospiraceae bacterium]
MYLALSSHIKQLDNLAETQFGIPVSVLMDNAGRGIFSALKADFSASDYAVFCGKGNNGGDGFKLAEYLKKDGKNVAVYLACEESQLSGIALDAFNSARECGIEIKSIADPVPEAAIIIDALLGISLSGAPRGMIKEAIDTINSHKNIKVSVDVPSGINVDTGKAPGSVVKADYTYTLQLDKVGLNVYPGIEYAGIKKIIDIGIPMECISCLQFQNHLIDEKYAEVLIPERKRNSHKGSFGRVGIVGGSEGMAGSVCLAAKAALRSGAGLVYVFVPDEIFDIVSVKLTEAIIVREGLLVDYIDKLDAIAVGMGYAQNLKKKHIIKLIIQKFKGNAVFDAGSIGYLSLHNELLKNKKCSAVLTPHPGEFSKLIDMSTEEIESNRMFLTTKYAKDFNSVLVLKGAASLVGSPSGELRINSTGNSGMATAGSGDVLSGIISGLLAQGMNNFDAATAGVYIHGLAGDLAAAENTEYCVTAGDIVKYLPDAFGKIFNK